ncbi:SDR family NAD(P)-dependent oxidoreductase [Bacillus sp. JJ634]
MLFNETTMEHFNLSFGTGFYPTFHFMQAAYPELKKSKGKVINFASGAGIDGQPTQTSYAAAKKRLNH